MAKYQLLLEKVDRADLQIIRERSSSCFRSFPILGNWGIVHIYPKPSDMWGGSYEYIAQSIQNNSFEVSCFLEYEMLLEINPDSLMFVRINGEKNEPHFFIKVIEKEKEGAYLDVSQRLAMNFVYLLSQFEIVEEVGEDVGFKEYVGRLFKKFQRQLDTKGTGRQSWKLLRTLFSNPT